MGSQPSPPRLKQKELSATKVELLDKVREHLKLAMGNDILVPRTRATNVFWIWLFGFLVVATLAVTVGLSRVPAIHEPAHAKLMGLLAWGGAYIAAALALARKATLDAIDIVEKDILPYASEVFVGSVAKELRDYGDNPQAIGVALVLSGMQLVATMTDITDTAFPASMRRLASVTPPIALELLLWWLTCFYLSFMSTRGALRAPFYLYFARALRHEIRTLDPLSANQSPLVVGISRLATRIFWFWAMIFLTIVAILALALLPAPYALPADSWLIFVVIPFFGFFSLGYGSMVFLESENEIRSVLRRFTVEQTRPLQRMIHALVHSGKVSEESCDSEIRRIQNLSDRIVEHGRYGNRLQAGVSIALPLILPVASLIATLFVRR